MSAITSDWAPIKTEVAVSPQVQSGKAYRREEEFRTALNNYIAGYVADQQERRTVATGSVGSAVRNDYFRVFRRALLLGRTRDSSRDAVCEHTSRLGDVR